MKWQNVETARQTGGRGKRIFTIPARIIGTEQRIVTKIVSATLKSNVKVASILDIVIIQKVGPERLLKMGRALILSENRSNDGRNVGEGAKRRDIERGAAYIHME
nr:hypothetical protein [uncultured Enterobacter sp.]